jgi:NAD(P)H-dependent FMN reductase
VLKNALDYLYAEWNRKPAAFVSFGNTGGARAVEQLREVAIELRMAALGEAVHILDAATAGTKSSSPCSSTAWRGGGAR